MTGPTNEKDTEMELDQSRIEAAVVQEVADRISGEDGDLPDRVRKEVDRRIERHFADVADAQIRAAVEAAIRDGFDREYCRVDAFGRREGEPTTIRAQLARLVEGYWNAKVDRQGKPATGYGADMTRAEWTMTQMVAADFKDTMKQHVVDLGGALKDALRLELHETINRLLSETFNVRSLDDQGKRRSDRSIIRPVQTPTKPQAPGASS